MVEDGTISYSPHRKPSSITGLGAIADAYDLILCDVWGVLHDGVRAYVETAEALMTFRNLDGAVRPRRVVLVSNAPRSGHEVRGLLDGLGIPRSAYDAILTSGDLARMLIAERPDAQVFHLGPDRTLGLFAGLDVTLVNPEAAGLVVCTALFNDEIETAENYATLLHDLHARRVPMICANPDLIVRRGDRLVPCAGAIAAAYSAIGGAVIYVGKPHRPIYAAAVAEGIALAGVAIHPTRTLAIGDAIRTDIAGAKNFGITALLVTRGIHGDELDGTDRVLTTWLSRQDVCPDAVIERLVW